MNVFVNNSRLGTIGVGWPAGMLNDFIHINRCFSEIFYVGRAGDLDVVTSLDDV